MRGTNCSGSMNLLFLLEAVTSHGPLSPKRQIELEKVLVGCKAKKVYISAFPDFANLKDILTTSHGKPKSG